MLSRLLFIRNPEAPSREIRLQYPEGLLCAVGLALVKETLERLEAWKRTLEEKRLRVKKIKKDIAENVPCLDLVTL